MLAKVSYTKGKPARTSVTHLAVIDFTENSGVIVLPTFSSYVQQLFVFTGIAAPHFDAYLSYHLHGLSNVKARNP